MGACRVTVASSRPDRAAVAYVGAWPTQRTPHTMSGSPSLHEFPAIRAACPAFRESNSMRASHAYIHPDWEALLSTSIIEQVVFSHDRGGSCGRETALSLSLP